MKKIFSILMIAGAALAVASCDLGQFPESATDTRLAETELAARKVLTVSDGYLHGQVYGDTYKTTVTLLSQGMKIAYEGTKASYAGSGYVLEIEFNSQVATGLVAGTYVADELDVEATAAKGKNVWKHNVGTFNPDNTSLKYISGDESEVVIESAEFTVAKEGSNFSISADILSNTGVRTNIAFNGPIEFRDVWAYLEPSKVSAITINCTGAELKPYSKNADLFGTYAVYQEYGMAPQYFDVILTGENGETVDVSIYEVQFYDDPITVESFTNIPTSGIYSAADEGICPGYWDMTDSEGNYNIALAYRDQAPIDSHVIISDGIVYYLGYGAGDSVRIVVDEKGVVTSLAGSFTSANGSTFNVAYAAKK